jgi:hypothetical protein
VILAVGYRVKSPRGTHLRQWATAQLEQHLVKGFAMDDECLKQAGGQQSCAHGKFFCLHQGGWLVCGGFAGPEAGVGRPGDLGC